MCGNLQTQEHREDRQNHTLCAQLLDFQMHTGMKTLAMMMMMMMMSSYSALSDQSLKCYNDFYNTFTCVWDTSNLDVIPPIRPETECWITVSVEKRSTRLSNLEKKEATLIADPMQPHIRSATVVFQSKRGIIISIAELHEEVRCKNYTNPVAEIAKHKAAVSAVKVAPPQKVDVHGGNVSWSCDSLIPYLDAEFGVQYRSAAQSWKDVEEIIVKTTELELELPKDDLLLNHQYVIRVRVRYDLPNAVWSDWSEEYSWTSDVGQTPQTAGLKCYNDYYNTFTCVWDTSNLDVIPPIRPETECWITVSVEKKSTHLRNLEKEEAALIADPMQPHIRSATVVFQNKRGIIISVAELHEEVRCKNYTNPVAEIAKHKAAVSAVKVAPPQKVDVHGGNVSWSWDSLKPFLDAEFGVQYRSAAQSWKDVEDIIVKTTEPELELPKDDLLLNHQYVIRVRVRYQREDMPNAVWSDWSEEYSWTSDVGQTPQTTEILPLDSSKAGIMLSGITLAIILILTILVKCKRTNRNVAGSSFRVQKKGSTYIPDPSKFFGDLNSSHRGNFKSWLGTVSVHESFIRVDTEFISSVEVVKLQDACDSRSTHRNSGSLQETWSDNVKFSNFSNSTYFLSQSSKGPSDTLEPCSAHSSYGPAGGVSGSETLPQRIAEEMDGEELEFSLKKLEKLRQDTQSPDSGFAGGAEDSMEETELPSPLCLTLTPLLPQDLPTPQPSRHPLLDLQRMDLLLRPSCMIPGLDLDLQSGCGLIEPSSDDYMPVKNVQR